MEFEEIKEKVGIKAASLIKPQTTIGLGSGSTAKAFIKAVIRRHIDENITIRCVPTSVETENLARQGRLPLLTDFSRPMSIDTTFDGADWIDNSKRVIKGYGGALLREKIVASASKQLVLMIDERKLCPTLTGKLLPIEIVSFGFATTIHHIERLGGKGTLRTKLDKTLYYTDNHNLIFDIEIPADIEIDSWNQRIRLIPGVVETGLFIGFNPTVIVGYSNGSVEMEV